MAVTVARVHLKVAHAALPALLPTPPMWKTMLPLFPTPPPCIAAAILPKPLAKTGRADADERWDARKTTPASTASQRKNKNGTSPPPPKPGRADSLERWDAHKKAAASSASSSSSSARSSLGSTSKKWPISRATSSAESWDAHKERRPPQTTQRLDAGDESSSTSSNDDDIHDTEEEEEIVWKPRAMYAGPGFLGAAPESRLLPMPTAFLVPVA